MCLSKLRIHQSTSGFRLQNSQKTRNCVWRLNIDRVISNEATIVHLFAALVQRTRMCLRNLHWDAFWFRVLDNYHVFSHACAAQIHDSKRAKTSRMIVDVSKSIMSRYTVLAKSSAFPKTDMVLQEQVSAQQTPSYHPIHAAQIRLTGRSLTSPLQNLAASSSTASSEAEDEHKDNPSSAIPSPIFATAQTASARFVDFHSHVLDLKSASDGIHPISFLQSAAHSDPNCAESRRLTSRLACPQDVIPTFKESLQRIHPNPREPLSNVRTPTVPE